MLGFAGRARLSNGDEMRTVRDTLFCPLNNISNYATAREMVVESF
jgi:hypothetical protein